MPISKIPMKWGIQFPSKCIKQEQKKSLPQQETEVKEYDCLKLTKNSGVLDDEMDK